MPKAVSIGLLVAAVAIGLRLTLSVEVGGEQAIFAYPAIIIATLLAGARAGAIAGLLCLLALWYYIIPDAHSPHIANARGVITLVIYTLVGSALICFIAAMRRALASYQSLAATLEELVQKRTAERNRLWDLSKEAIATIDLNGGIADSNPSFRRLVPPEALASPLANAIVPQDRPAFVDHISSLGCDGHGSTLDARIAGVDGVRCISWNMVRDGGLTYLVGRDFTDEHRCAQQLLQSHKMELVGHVVGGLAHDFGNILSSINIVMHLLRIRAAQQPGLLELVGMAEQSSMSGEALISRLLSFARPGDHVPEPAELNSLLSDILPLIRRSVINRRFEFVSAGPLPMVRVDPNEFGMALMNLSINARDATAEGGMLTLSATQQDEHTVDIVLADDGKGMDAETLRRTCEPFFSTKGPDEGTGLGLVMVNRFASGAGGRFGLDSAPGRGTRAKITLPVALESSSDTRLTTGP